MGPRLVSRGRLFHAAHSSQSTTSFNGATAGEPWKTIELDYDKARAACLQWGHGW